MPSTFTLIAVAVAGALLLAAGLGVRFGRYRRWVANIHRLHPVLRNTPFAWTLVGGGMLLLVASVAGSGGPSPLGALVFAASLALMGAAALVVLRPPNFLVPEDLRTRVFTDFRLRDEIALATLFVALSGPAILFGAAALVALANSR